ncbi:MAG: hypothetical protein LQ348_001385 [Seirophora lacunosa]|nr:MAG: hypothetical protein LQ348_001385 [Seirophora lacunosa]
MSLTEAKALEKSEEEDRLTQKEQETKIIDDVATTGRERQANEASKKDTQTLRSPSERTTATTTFAQKLILEQKELEKLKLLLLELQVW